MRPGRTYWVAQWLNNFEQLQTAANFGKLSLTAAAPAWLSICGMWTLCNNENTAFGISPVICNKMRFTCEYESIEEFKVIRNQESSKHLLSEHPFLRLGKRVSKVVDWLPIC